MRICIVPEYPMDLMTGGLQVQAVETCNALSALNDGTTAELFDWSKTQAPCDLYHFIGFPSHLHQIPELVRRAGRPYVLTILLANPRGYFRLRISAARRLVGSRFMGKKARDQAIAHAARIVTMTDMDAAAAAMIFGVDKSKIEVVPNGVTESFFKTRPEEWHKTYGKKDFVLCVAAIRPLKNQLLLAQACNRLKLPLVLLGPILSGETEYARKVGEAMRENESYGGRWLQDLRNEDELFLSAYSACRVFALLSNSEGQPLSVMQAMAARKPILLREAAYAQDKLFCHLPTVNSDDVAKVASALQTVWETAKPTELSPEYSWHNVARRLQTIYARILKP